MLALPPENCSFQSLTSRGSQALDGSGVLLLIILGKTSLNLFVLGMRRKMVYQSFLEYFSISVAVIDFTLLATLSFIAYFEDFALWDVRFTKYHMCLFTQIISFTYGFSHYPVFLVAGLDYYATVSRTSRPPPAGQKLSYAVAVILIWISIFFYTLEDPTTYSSWTARGDVYFYQCPFYVSSQSYRLSLAILLVLFSVLVACWSEIVALIRSTRIASYMNETVLFFPSAAGHAQAGISRKQLSTKLTICFLGTWAPFVFLQMLLLILDARVPAYIEMNVPWLYFINSFLIAAAYWVRRPERRPTETAFSTDPFVSWEFCFVPFTEPEGQAEKPLSVITC
ncbi:probable G-protein coupled receptor 160 [Tachyglossus aculeatus]|uniref:probable G-protein coupled receptor 160 n=1 Tax=Tachyglossus aculeatus TaxID=9261 RepID=UPI0018F69EA3|nr:probable G-protein coupled receptor 160 [Tachyglossus aculeatus]